MCNEIPSDFARTYHVRLLFKEKPIIDVQKLEQVLSIRVGKLDNISDKRESIIFAFEEFMVEYSDATIPAQIAAFISDEEADMNEIVLNQSWSWNEANHVVSQCRYSLDCNGYYRDTGKKYD